MSNPLVSVIIPVYNEEAVLRRCIDSLLCQTYRNIEILVIDDGSSDESVSIVKSIHDERLVVIMAEHKGVSSARNIGLQKMNGEFFTFVDADDYVANTYVETLISDIEKYQADIAFTKLMVLFQNEVSEYSNPIGEKIVLTEGKEVIESCFGLDLDEYSRTFNAGVCGRMIRTAFYMNQKTQFDELFTYGEDARWLFPHVMRAKRIVMDDKAEYYYHRVRGKYTDYPANIKYYSWRLSFFRENEFPAYMISATEDLLHNNQFSHLIRDYPTVVRFRDRVDLVKQQTGLGIWLLAKKKGWSLCRMKMTIMFMSMRMGVSGRLVKLVCKPKR